MKRPKLQVLPYRHSKKYPYYLDLRPFGKGRRFFKTKAETILALKPVTFRYKHELDPKGVPQFGLVAEDVAKANPDLVADEGKPYTVRYDAVNAMLLNESLREHRRVEQLEKELEKLTAGPTEGERAA